MNKYQIANQIIEDSGGIAETSDLLQGGLDIFDICRLSDEGQICRIRRGYYKLPQKSISQAEYIAKLIPEGTVCMESALFHYGYLSEKPPKWSLALPRAVSQMKVKANIVPAKPYYIQPYVIDLGRVESYFGNTILPVYDRERTICDCFKYKNRIEENTFAKIIAAYSKDSRRKPDNLYKYAKQLRVYGKVKEIMEIVLFADTKGE